MTAPKSGQPFSDDIDASLGVPPDPAAALKAVLRKIAANLEARTDPDLAGWLKISTAQPRFYKLWQGRSARNARAPRAEALEACAVHRLAVDGVLHQE